MTISTEAIVAGPFTGNDVTSAFSFAFKVFADTDVLVKHQADEETEGETAVLNTDYTVTRNADQDANPGGTITWKIDGVTAALPQDELVTITSQVPATQATALPTGGSYAAKTVERMIDKVTILVKQFGRSIVRSVRQPITDASLLSELPPAATRANKVFGFDALGDIELYEPESAVTTAANLTWLDSATGALSRLVSLVLGDYPNILTFIPSALHAGIRARTSTTDLSTYITAAYAAYKSLRWPAGRYYTTASVNLTAIFGAGVIGESWNGTPADWGQTEIVINATNTPGLRLWGPVRVENLYVRYAAQQAVSDTESRTIEFNNIANASLHNVKAGYGCVNFGIKQANFSTFNAVWDSVLSNLYSYSASGTHFDFRNFNGGGTNTEIINPYANGGGSADFVTPGQSCEYFMRVAICSGYKIGTCSFEACQVDTVPIELNNFGGSIDNIRFEAADYNGAADSWIKMTGGYGYLVNDIQDWKNCKWTPSVATSMYLIRTSQTVGHVSVGNVIVRSDCDFGVSGTRRVLFNSMPLSGTGYRNGVHIHSIEDQGAKLSDIISWTESSISTQPFPVRTFDGALVNWRTKAGRSGAYQDHWYDSAPPTAGTWKVGDMVHNSRPDLNGIVTWVCTLAGTPGVWHVAEEMRAFSVRLFDDFLGDVLADQWNTRVGSDPQCVAFAIDPGKARGQIIGTCGDDAGSTMALNGVQLDHGLNWQASGSGLAFEFRIMTSSITGLAVFVGFTDQVAALEMPFTLGAADALTSNCDDGVGVLFDTAADTDQWCLVGTAAGVDATHQFAGVAPTAGVMESWRIEVTTAGVATFYRNGVAIGTAMTGAVTAATLLTPVIAGFSRTSATRAISGDFVDVRGKR